MRGRRAGSFDERFNVWPGFTDIMVGLLLVFVFVVTLFTISETILSRSLSKKDKELERLHNEISQKADQMERLAKEISLKVEELQRLRIEISRLEKLFESQLAKTTSLEELLAARSAELADATAELLKKSFLVDEKDQLLVQQARDLESALAEVRDKSAKLLEQELVLSEQRQEIQVAIADLQGKSSLLQEKEKQVSELGLKLSGVRTKLSTAETKLSEKREALSDLATTIESLNSRIAALNKKIADYVDQVSRLNQMVADAKASETTRKTKASQLHKEIKSLTAKLNEISKKLAKVKKAKDKQFRLAKLVNLIGQKDKEIDRLRKLAKYRSEFLAKLQKVFAGVSDIKVQGDRFIFQSEILFASGSAVINPRGKKELDKFIRIYKEMIPKIPKALPILILIQGHTDIVPVKSAQYRSNWELSSARAMHVVRYMIDKGIPPTRLGASALGEFHPVSKRTSAAAKRRNRRIEIKITTL